MDADDDFVGPDSFPACLSFSPPFAEAATGIVTVLAELV